MSNRSHRLLAADSRTKLLAVLVLLAMLLTTVTAGVSAQSARDDSKPNQAVPGATAEPNKIVRTEGAKPGVYYIDYGTTILDPAKYPVDGAIRFYGWSTLNTGDGTYNWAELDNFMKTRKDSGLGTAIMITTYDGSDAGDIRSTPNFVIKQANAVLPATYKTSSSDTNEANQPHYVNYWKRDGYNANFDYRDHTYAWTASGNASIESAPMADPDGIAGGYAGKLGGVDGATGALVHGSERVPAMPSGISPAKTVFVTARVGIQTTDPNPNDHLTIELQDAAGNKLGGTQVDITNLSHPNNTWADYTFDVSAFGTEKSVQVAFKVSNDGANPTTFYVDNVTLNVRHLIPNYWPDTDAQRTYYKAYKKFIDALGARYKNNADLQFVAIGAGVYGENQPTQSDNYPDWHFDHVVEKYGNLTGADWVQFVNQLSLDYATAFSAGDGSGPARHLFTQYAPSYKSATERRDITNYAQGVGVGLSANFLPVDYTQAYRSDDSGFYDPTRRYWNSVPVAFESYKMDLCNPLMTYWALFGGLEKHVDYLRTDPTLLRNPDGTQTANVPLYAWANDFMGKTAQNTPKVWTVMREHRNPTLANCRGGGIPYVKSGDGGSYPELGNYNFFMQQIDSVPGGRTVPETNDKGVDSRYAKNPANGTAAPDAGLGNCPVGNGYRADLFGTDYPCFKTPYNSELPPIVGQDATLYNIKDWSGGGKEAFVVRRTDQATGNPYMFFRIDDAYMYGSGSTVYKATFTVKYFDLRAGKFTVKYDSTSGEKIAGTVVETGSKQYKTASFTVTDAKFANRLPGNTDFFIDSQDPDTKANDGDEWIHMVEVERLDAGVEPPTVTPTPTVTATPSATPSPTPSTGSVQGVAFNDVNGNKIFDATESGVAGAEIVLEEYPSGVEKASTLSGANGAYVISVAPGQYTLKEKTAPPGYEKNTDSLRLAVSANQVISDMNFGHKAGVATLDNKLYLPMMVK